MVIDFNNIEESVMPHFKDGEGNTVSRIFFDGLNKIMRGRLDVGCTIGYHKHEGSSEVILVTSGVARCLYDDEERLTVGQVHYCPRGHSHSLILPHRVLEHRLIQNNIAKNASATEPLEYFAIVPEQYENN